MTARNLTQFTALTIALAAALACAACAEVGPDYKRPAFEMPAAWKLLPGADPAQWHTAAPGDAVPKAEWWRLFGDAELNELEARAAQGNFSLQVAVERLNLAQAQARLQGAALDPTVQLGASATRTRTSADRPLSTYSVPNVSTVQNNFQPMLSVSYEFDWLGRIQRDIEAAKANAAQAAADSQNVRLLISAQVAGAYFQLRELDDESQVLQASLALQDKVLVLVKKRHAQGASSLGDVVQQQALLDASAAQLALLKSQRNQQEDAIATLLGVSAAEFHLPAGTLPAALPNIPVTLPSQLLERRPDIASAERAMAAANAQIGVAQAGYFPTLSLAPTFGGSQSNTFSNLLSAPSLIWSLGLMGAQTLFDGGRVDATVDAAKANYAGSVASYKQSVLVAVQEAQDAMGNLQELGSARQRQDQAVQNLNQAYRIGLTRYQEGLDNALTLAVVQQSQLAAQRVQTQIQGSQALAAVSLVKALGGGWEGQSGT